MRRILPEEMHHAEIKRVIDVLVSRGDTVAITPQVLVEFQALATRPKEANGLGMMPLEANQQSRYMEERFEMLVETPLVYTRWRDLMERYEVRGRQVYDARLVAVMLTHEVECLLTGNASHFRRYSEITVIDPHNTEVS